MTDITFNLEHHGCDFCWAGTDKTGLLCVGHDVSTARDLIVCERCLEADNLDERLKKKIERLLASIAHYRSMIGRVKPPTHREWLERRCIADFAVSHRRGYFLPQLRKSWRERQRDCECFALDREVFSKFAAMSEKELIALAIPHYPAWSTTVTVSNEIAAKSHHDEVLSEPGAFKLPIKDSAWRRSR
jgi:hypothetical protein